MCVFFFRALSLKINAQSGCFAPSKKGCRNQTGMSFLSCVYVCVCSKKAGKALNLKIENTEREGARGAETER